MFYSSKYQFTTDNINTRLDQIKLCSLSSLQGQELYKFLLNSIDLTTLEGLDNSLKINELYNKAKSFIIPEKNILGTAAVCVYPVFVKKAKELFADTAIKIVSVAGAFPSSQSPLEIRLAETKFALDEGADEIDIAISRGKFLEGNFDAVYDEIVAFKKVCGKKIMKVILETGELKTSQNIYLASKIAIEAGADFLKTSTGKIPVNATPEAFIVMCDAVKEHYLKTGKKTGVKVAGGIADTDTAIFYFKILENTLPAEWKSISLFRIGATKLADKIFEKIC